MRPEAPRLDAAQQAVLSLPVDASGVVIGAAGTGKTLTLAARVEALLRSGAVEADEILVLTPSRHSATRLRDDLGVRVAAATPGALARSLGSLAFQIVRAASVHAGRPAPQLLTGADQDRIIAELLRSEDADREGVSRWPDALPPEARGSRSFRSELRTMMDLCVELGVAAPELAALGQSLDRAAWPAVASFMVEYRDVLARVRTDHRGAADLVAEAAALLRDAPAGATGADVLGPVARLRCVLVDDAQELTAGHQDFILALRARGIAVLAFGDPDIGSGAFRGITPELFARTAAQLGAVHVLDEDHRSTPAIARLARFATQGIGAGGRVDHRRDPGPDIDDDRVSALVADSPHEEMDAIARTLRDWHVMAGIPWSQMAVIAHDTRQIVALDDELAAREVPTRAAGVQRPLGQESVVRAILGVIKLGITDPSAWEGDDLAAALTSPFGGLDAIGLRRLRAALRRAEFRGGGTSSAAELLRSAMAYPLELTMLDASEAHEAERLATTLRWVRESHERGETVHELLWLVWDRAREDGNKLAVTWRERASVPGPSHGESNRALDALVALFEAAKRAVERGTDATAEAFIRVILDTDVPEDTLAAPERGGSVTLLTPATALGTEFDAVILAGVQDGVWPNVRLRGGLLDSWLLADAVAAARAGESPRAAAAVDRRRAALYDELRLFVRAISRARTRLMVCAVDDDDTGPSALLSLLPGPIRPAEDAAAAHPLTLRGLVAAHRRTLTSPHVPDVRRAEAAGQLRALADAGVVGADPDEWYGVQPLTSTAPLRDGLASAVAVSPSKMEGFEECALDWAIRALGGDTRTSATGLGTIMHAAMEEMPTATAAELEAYVDARWGELDFESDWLAHRERRWASTLVARLHAYLRGFQADGATNIAAEAEFRLAVPMIDDVTEADVSVANGDAFTPPLREGTPYAVLRGSIDRVEVYPPGAGDAIPQHSTRTDADRVVVVDLKTGKSEGRFLDSHVTDDAQLLSYQLAVRAGAVPGADPADSAGARLLVLSKDTKDSLWRIAHQDALDGPTADEFVQRIVADARGMASDHFTANLDGHCRVATFAVCSIHTIKAVSSS